METVILPFPHFQGPVLCAQRVCMFAQIAQHTLPKKDFAVGGISVAERQRFRTKRMCATGLQRALGNRELKQSMSCFKRTKEIKG